MSTPGLQCQLQWRPPYTLPSSRRYDSKLSRSLVESLSRSRSGGQASQRLVHEYRPAPTRGAPPSYALKGRWTSNDIAKPKPNNQFNKLKELNLET